VIVRISPAELDLPSGRETWAPEGILAYSKICTHAACSISLYRAPLYEPTSPRPALVCPCHYSTFDVRRGAAVIFGPAGRPLPQLPLAIDSQRHLVATGGFSGPPGPSWLSVRRG
jgi:ubiquinol-cytochrome c reductase iron-sulfur subunit